ncbi:hypothetical protein [Methanobacterium alcaliphilum]|uniref:hypothetical protein n=1 Tax=Methanobacterium alcaliphilum TaxID=392018 RepID=UPI00200B1E8E|nr:hypothetical protein [Methanobacterium alcaliphilum]MCK9152303.1 hypothetical protein [Methanobacterium alcaliphilum]
MTSIMELENKIKYLKITDEESYHLFHRIFTVSSGEGFMVIPPDLKNKVINQFGRKDEYGHLLENPGNVINRIEKQKIIKTFNNWTYESALFNYIRTSRPISGDKSFEDDQKQISILINDSKTNCDFCNAEKCTPQDIFKKVSLSSNGRIKGKNSITASNLAKYDLWSSLVIFKNHNPLKFNLEELSDVIDTAFTWFKEAYAQNQDYKFPFFVWNCLYKAGASQVHGHAQILMSKDKAYAKMESMRKISSKYQKENGSDYFHDIFKIHSILGLGFSLKDVRVYASITPIKEKEIMILASKAPHKDLNIKQTIYGILRCFIDIMRIHSFNLAIYCPPMDGEYNFPYLIKIVDRGNIFRPTVDMGGMELFGSTVVADDPYKIINNVKQYLEKSN